MIVIAPSWPDDPADTPPPFTFRAGRHGIVDMHYAAFVEHSRLPEPKWMDFNPHAELIEHIKVNDGQRPARLDIAVPYPHRLIIDGRPYFQPAMAYSSDPWDSSLGHFASSWQAVPLFLRFRKYDTGQFYYLQKAEQSFLLQFECFISGTSQSDNHDCVGFPKLWFAVAEGRRPKIYGMAEFGNVLSQIRRDRMLWWRAFKSRQEAEKWDPLPDAEMREWLARSRLRLREDWRDPNRKPLSLRTPKPSIQQDFYAAFVDGEKTLYTDKAKFEAHIAKCPDAEWQKFDNVKDALAWTGGGGAEAAAENTASEQAVETSSENELEGSSNSPPEESIETEAGDGDESELGGRESPGESSSGSSTERLSPPCDGSPLSSGLSVDSQEASEEETIVKAAPNQEQEDESDPTTDEAVEPASEKPVPVPSEQGTTEDRDGPDPTSPLLSTLQHEIEWCQRYPATNSNWVPVRFSFDGGKKHPT